MSDTPRTDAASRMAFSGEYMVEMEEAQKIERELADMTKQRDALAEKLTKSTQEQDLSLQSEIKESAALACRLYAELL